MKHKNGPSARIGICLPQSLNDTLSEWARTEDRALANLVYALVKQAVAERERTVSSQSLEEETVNESV